jgi:hypothetical protein
MNESTCTALRLFAAFENACGFVVHPTDGRNTSAIESNMAEAPV